MIFWESKLCRGEWLGSRNLKISERDWDSKGYSNLAVESLDRNSMTEGGCTYKDSDAQVKECERNECMGCICVPDFKSWQLIYRWKWMRMSGYAPRFSEATSRSSNDSMHIGESETCNSPLWVLAVPSYLWVAYEVPVLMLCGWIFPIMVVSRWASALNRMIFDLGHTGPNIIQALLTSPCF